MKDMRSVRSVLEYLPDVGREELEDILATIETCLIAERGVSGIVAPDWMLVEWGKIARECNRKLALQPEVVLG